jgi:hypothetical protein
LEDDFKLASSESRANKLKPILESFISMDLEIRKEAFDRLVKGNVMSREFVVLEVILKI